MQQKSQKQTIKKTNQKKFKFLRDKNPIYFLEVFEYEGKTHYIISQSSLIYFGRMQRNNFTPIYNNQINSYVTSFKFNKRQNATLYFGLKNGSILYGSIKAIYQSIPLQAIQSVDGKAILQLLPYRNEKGQDIIFTIDEDASLKQYMKLKNHLYKFRKQINLECKIGLVNAKNTEDVNSPCLMIQVLEAKYYPLILTGKIIQQAFDGKCKFNSYNKVQETEYFQDQRVLQKITAIDFDPVKKIAILGYINGTIQMFSLESRLCSETVNFIMLPQLQVKYKDSITYVSLNISQGQNCCAFTNQKILSALNYKYLKNNHYLKVKNAFQINCIKWTIDNLLVVGSISNANNKLEPKIYCIILQQV